jgi:uncharacterized membrane protein YeaQ/YmgE (transglycosylase-associated protein family)
MSHSSDSLPVLPEGFQAGSIIALPRPDKRAFPLTHSEFKILHEGAHSSDRAGRDTCTGIFLTTLVSLIGICLTVDWSSFWTQKRWGVLAYFLVTVFIGAGALVLLVFYHLRTGSGDTPCSRLEEEIKTFFLEPTAASSDSPPSQESITGIPSLG